MKKYLASFICSALIIGTISISCNSVKADNVDEEQFDSLLYQYADDPFVAEAIDEMEKNAIEFRSQDYYMRQITNDDETTVDSNVYSEKEYNLMKNDENISTFTLKPGKNPTVKNSWIKLTLEAYKQSNEYYTFTLHYDWVDTPNLRFTDVIALGHDSNFSFDTTSMKSYHKHSGYNNKSSSFSYTYSKNYPTNLYAKDYYVGAKFNLDSNPLYGLDKYSGYIQAKGRFTNSSTSSGTLSFLYGHLQAGLSFSLSTSITKKGECSLSFSPNLSISYDQFQHQDEFVK